KNTFGKPIIPANENIRIEAVNEYVVLDGFPDKYFNEVAQIIARSFDTPIALISIVGSEQVEFKGNFGMEGVNTVDRGTSLCSLAVLDHAPTIFNDASKEPCLLTNPLVAGEFGLRFYAGVPLRTQQGLNIGTVCVVDKEPRDFTEKELELLDRFAGNVMKELEDRRLLRVSSQAEQQRL
ncbi:MAG: GAF domain-containing protein, partial [Chitinophagaceae bacterium]|nr:GAF domain-containing protein [Chitinophagaceae bacterium]